MVDELDGLLVDWLVVGAIVFIWLRE